MSSRRTVDRLAGSGLVVAALLLFACVRADPSGDRGASVTGAPSASETVQVPVAPSTGAAFLDVRTGETTPLPSEITSWPDASHLQMSPDGSMIAFDADWEIYVANADGTGVRRLTRGEGLRSVPAWSPDGSRLVYVERHFTGGHVPRDALAAVDVFTSERVRVIGDPGVKLLPSFTPDGSTVVFTRQTRFSFSLWTVPAAGGTPTMLLRDAGFGAVSPDGSTIAFHDTGSAALPGIAYRIDPSVWLADADGSRRRRVAGVSEQVGTTADRDWTRPLWSPDGTRIAYQDSMDDAPGPIIVAWVHGRPRAEQLGIGSWPSWADDHTLIVHENGGP